MVNEFIENHLSPKQTDGTFDSFNGTLFAIDCKPRGKSYIKSTTSHEKNNTLNSKPNTKSTIDNSICYLVLDSLN